jgi:type IV pilus assembly protein PilX
MSELSRMVARERGMVLITSLIILLVLTLLGLASIQNTNMEERMAGNLRAENVAFQAAEAALRAGEACMTAQLARPKVDEPLKPTDACGSPGFRVRLMDDPGKVVSPSSDSDPALYWETWTADDWADPYTDAYDHPEGLSFAVGEVLPTAPRLVIEERDIEQESLVIGQQQDFAAGRWFYQVTAHATDAGGRGEVMLRSTYARRF